MRQMRSGRVSSISMNYLLGLVGGIFVGSLPAWNTSYFSFCNLHFRLVWKKGFKNFRFITTIYKRNVVILIFFFHLCFRSSKRLSSNALARYVFNGNILYCSEMSPSIRIGRKIKSWSYFFRRFGACSSANDNYCRHLVSAVVENCYTSKYVGIFSVVYDFSR